MEKHHELSTSQADHNALLIEEFNTQVKSMTDDLQDLAATHSLIHSNVVGTINIIVSLYFDEDRRRLEGV